MNSINNSTEEQLGLRRRNVHVEGESSQSGGGGPATQQQHQHYINAAPAPTQKPPLTSLITSTQTPNSQSSQPYQSNLYIYSTETLTGRILTYIAFKLPLTPNTQQGSALPGFFALLLLTMANYMLSPMRDATALAVGVNHIPALTLASTVLALASTVPMGWLFEAPDPSRSGRSWRDKLGVTRGETQGTSLALFLRCFAICLLGYALTFKVLEWFEWNLKDDSDLDDGGNDGIQGGFMDILDLFSYIPNEGLLTYLLRVTPKVLQKFGFAFYVVFFLVVHLMKLHSLSLIWGVTSEAMEYEEQAENRERKRRKMMKEQQQQQRYDLGHDNMNCNNNSVDEDDENEKPQSGKQSRVRLKRLAFVGFGGTLGGISGSVFVSMTAHTLRLSGLLVVAAIVLFLSAELSIELGQIMLRHWEEEQMEIEENDKRLLMQQRGQLYPHASDDDLLSLSHDSSEENMTSTSLATTMSYSTVATNHEDVQNGHSSLMRHVSSSNLLSGGGGGGTGEIDTCMKKVSSYGSMKRVASVNSLGNNRSVDTCMKRISSSGSMKRIASGNSIAAAMRSQNSSNAMDGSKGGNKNNIHVNTGESLNALSDGTSGKLTIIQNAQISIEEDLTDGADDENTFKQRLLRGVNTILKSRLLMTIFMYNALYATTTTLLSFQRAELVANRSSKTDNNMHSDTAFLARINIISSVAVFALQASGVGAFIASTLGQRGTLSLMPMVRMMGVAMLILWHIKGDGSPPNLIFFLILDEFTKVINFAVAKPVRESLWRGLSNEARYEAKPIVDTLANRWGSGSAAFLMSLLDRIMIYTDMGEELEDGKKSLFGFPPLWILCAIAAVWWAFVSADLGYTRHRIDLELKKQQ